MNSLSSSQDDKTQLLIDILKTVPIGTLQYTASIHLHTNGSVNLSRVSSLFQSLFQGKALYILDEPIVTKQHKRHFGFERRDTELHIELF